MDTCTRSALRAVKVTSPDGFPRRDLFRPEPAIADGALHRREGASRLLDANRLERLIFTERHARGFRISRAVGEGDVNDIAGLEPRERSVDIRCSRDFAAVNHA